LIHSPTEAHLGRLRGQKARGYGRRRLARWPAHGRTATARRRAGPAAGRELAALWRAGAGAGAAAVAARPRARRAASVGNPRGPSTPFDVDLVPKGGTKST